MSRPGVECGRTNPYGGDVKFLRGVCSAAESEIGASCSKRHKDKHLMVILAVKRPGSNTY
jgi:hypothetical protein